MKISEMIINLWTYDVNKTSIINHTKQFLYIPKTYKTDLNRTKYVIRYVDLIINKYIKKRRKELYENS